MCVWNSLIGSILREFRVFSLSLAYATGFELPENFDLEIRKKFNKHRYVFRICEYFVGAVEEMDQKRGVREAASSGTSLREENKVIPLRLVQLIATTTVDGERDQRVRVSNIKADYP